MKNKNYKEERLPFEFKLIQNILIIMAGISWFFAFIELSAGKLFILPAFMILFFLIASLFFFPKRIEPRQEKLDTFG